MKRTRLWIAGCLAAGLVGYAIAQVASPPSSAPTAAVPTADPGTRIAAEDPSFGRGKAVAPAEASASSEALRAADERGARLLREVAALRAEQDALRTSLAATARQHAAAPPAATNGDEEPEPEDVTPERVIEREAAQAAVLDELIDRESIDPVFSEEMNLRIRGFFDAQAGRGVHAVQSECRTTLCRVEVATDTIQARAALLEGVSGLLPPDAEGYAYVEHDADTTIEVYLSRSGMVLPSPE